MAKKQRKIFIGAGWPYANGFLHFGHIAALLPADILARYHRLKGDRVLFVSGSDCHGTPISVEAEKQHISPQDIAEKYDKQFRQDLIEGLGFTYDIYSKTTSPKHAKVVQKIFLTLLKKGLIYPKKQELPFCPKCRRFLPDRYIEGICPKCGFSSARGDQCDNCGILLDPKDLIEPRCKICGQKPQWQETEHFFLKLSALENKIKQWIKKQKTWRPNAYQFSLNLFKQGLKDRAITRDIDWGIEIPLKGYENKRIYVWFEAVCGYLSASQEWSGKWKDFWQKPSYHYYVHGKDNILFHTVIWPAILMGVGRLNLPSQIVSSEYLNLEGKQFSKSRKWAVWLPNFLEKFEPESLRYYLTINGPETTDASFSWQDYFSKTNSELVANFGNFIHRVLGFSYSNFGSKISSAKSSDKESKEFLDDCAAAFKQTGGLIEKGEFRKALRIVFGLAEKGNRYIDKKAPWQKIKKDKAEAQKDIGVCLRVIFNLRILASPFLPVSCQKIDKIFNCKGGKKKWEFQEIPKGLKLSKPEPLYQPIDRALIDDEIGKLH